MPWWARYSRTRLYARYVFDDGQVASRFSAWTHDENYSWLQQGVSVRVVSDPVNPQRNVILLPDEEI